MLFNCGNCGLTREVSEKFSNKTVKCSKCKADVTIGFEEIYFQSG